MLKHIKLTEDFAKKRLVIIGDIHGCASEFKTLIKEHVKKEDIVVLVGDIVNSHYFKVIYFRLIKDQKI